MSRGHGGVSESQIYSDNIRMFLDDGFRHIDDHMQPPCAFTQEKVCRGNLAPGVASAKRWDGKRKAHLSSCGRHANGLSLPIEGEGFLVVAHWTALALRTAYRLEDRL